ncbi:hypothetical protein [Bacillus marinisedimentorum]|uniref:hypothetical protein n=1 Tax=Bacillus marinisedimentorum TaxID=1821260 RepID=UPI0008723181|nr:hypothetical protein [Bacillus marinisedimentorum]
MPRFNQLSFLLFTILLAAVILSGCTQSEEEVLAETETAVEEEFSAQPAEPNKTTKLMEFYVPENMSMESEDGNNFVLAEEDQQYLLFFNQLEDEASEALYKDIARAEESLLLESFKEDGRFGFIKVISVGDNGYEVITGIGGAKITAETERDELAEDSRKMMKIIRSIQKKEQKE